MSSELTETDHKARNSGRLMVGTSIVGLLLVALIGLLLITVSRQGEAIAALSNGVTQQRNQFEDCKNKPATAPGCRTPVAAEPSVIVKEVKVPVVRGLTGAAGLTPPCMYTVSKCQGAEGKPGLTPPCMNTPAKCQGAAGKDATPAKDGRDGATPPCMQTPRQCQGADGGQGPEGPAAKDGVDGITPPCYFTPMQCQGVAGANGNDGPACPAGYVSVLTTVLTKDSPDEGVPGYLCRTA